MSSENNDTEKNIGILDELDKPLFQTIDPEQLLGMIEMMPEAIDSITNALDDESTDDLKSSINMLAQEMSADSDAKSIIDDVVKKANIDPNTAGSNPMDLMLSAMDVIGSLDKTSMEKLSKMVNKSANGKTIQQLKTMISPNMMHQLMKQAQQPPAHNKKK